MHTRLFILIMILCTSLTANTDVENGKKLYDEANCARCHSSDIFTDEERAVKSYEKLVDRIQWCAVYQESGWNDKEIMSVIKFLNKNYYKYPVTD